MKITILTQYYPPEVGAPQNRLSELAVRLKRNGADVHVITAMPNYPHMIVQEGYRGKWRVSEEIEGIKVTSCWIYVPKSKSIFPRLMNYFSFVFSSFWIGLVRMKRSDFLICELQMPEIWEPTNPLGNLFHLPAKHIYYCYVFVSK